MKHMLIAFLFYLLSTFAVAGFAAPAPYLVTYPSPPVAGSPFEVIAYLPANPANSGFVSAPLLTGSDLYILFAFGVDYPTSTLSPFHLQIPSLPAGQYTLTVDLPTSPRINVATLPLGVTAAVAPTPSLGTLACSLLAALLLASTALHLRRRPARCASAGCRSK